MSVNFIYMKNSYEIKYNKNDLSITDLLINYSSKININMSQLRFLYKGRNIFSNEKNKKKKLNEFKDNNIKIFVYNIKIKKNKNTNNEDLKDIICPICKNVAIINNNNDKFSLNCLHNNHKFIDLTINWLYESQYFNESLINCNKCGNNKSYYNIFYIDSNNKYFCPLCSEEGTNNIIDYEYRFKFCINHQKQYISFCKNCNINLCARCEEKHKNHKIKIYKEIKPNEKKIKEIKEDEIKINDNKKDLKL